MTQQKNRAHTQYSQIVDKLSLPPEKREGRNLLQQTAERLGLEISELEEELEIIEDSMSEKDIKFVMKILKHANIVPEGFEHEENMRKNLMEWLTQ